MTAKTIIGVVLVLLALTGCAVWERPSHPSQVAAPPLAFTPPEPERITLACGATLYMLRDSSLPLFSLYAVARAGSAYDPPGKEGLAALTASVMRTGGTKRLSPEEVDNQLEFMAANVGTAANRDAGSISLSCLSKDIRKSMDILCDILLNPAFNQARLDLRKAQVREAIRRRDDEPGGIVSREFNSLIYGSYPYGHQVIGEPGSIDKIVREDLIAFHGDYFKPSGLIIGVAGDFDRDTIVRMLNDALGSTRASLPPHLPPAPIRPERTVAYIEKDTEQAHLMVGHPGIRRDNPDYFSIMVMNEILGAGAFSSRIPERVRVQAGLAYHAGTCFTINVRRGLFYAVCQTKEKSATEALSLILEEMERIRTERVLGEELDRAKDSFINSFVFNFKTASQIVAQRVEIEFFGLPPDYLKTYIARVSAVTEEDVLRAARTYLHPDRATILVLGEKGKFKPPLEKFGNVKTLKLEDVSQDKNPK
ncbi:MAG: pitrilysin family protein [bacterium]